MNNLTKSKISFGQKGRVFNGWRIFRHVTRKSKKFYSGYVMLHQR